MNQFEQDELLGRNLTEEFLRQAGTVNIEFTENQYDTVDLYFTHKGKKAVGEIKVRDAKYMNYPTHWIELDKYMNMTKAGIDNNCQSGMYFNFFDNYLYAYRLKDIDPSRITERYVSRTTSVDTGMRYKKFIEIPTYLAQVFVNDKGDWRRRC